MTRFHVFPVLLSVLAASLATAQTRPTTDPWTDAQEFVREGDYAKALPLLQRVVTADTANVNAGLQLAYAHQKMGTWAAAKRQYESLLLRRPNLAESLNQMAVISEREANYARALGFYRRLLAQDTTDAYFLKQVGSQHSRLNQSNAAIPYYRRALKQAPEDLEAIGELARLYLDIGGKDKLAQPLISRGLKLDGNSVRLLQLNSRLSYRTAAFRDVVRDIEKTMALGDTASYYQRLLGTAYYQIDSLKKSIRTFSRLLKLGEDTESVHAGLGTAHLLDLKPIPNDSVGKIFRLSEAHYHFRKAIELASTNVPDYQMSLADAMEKDHYPLDAIIKIHREVYEKYRRPKALYRLGQLQEKKKDYELAAIYYKEMVENCLNPNRRKTNQDCLFIDLAQARLLALKKMPGKGKPAPTAGVPVAKDTATAVPDTSNRDEK
ncbi:MAG: tetratricopeptide repeat protein [Cytophagaceae bacterium]|nr:tetratricopeptide repeat protein [Cytophagaceae bacterium]